MGMSYVPVFANYIKKENIEKLNLPTYQKLIDVIKKINLSFDNAANILTTLGDQNNGGDVPPLILKNILERYNINEEQIDDLIFSYRDFCTEFKEKTRNHN